MSIKLNIKKSKGKSASSKKWLRRHLNDPYVALSKQHAYRSRAAFKIIQINEKFKIFNNTTSIVDIGCAPGGWLQVSKHLSPKATIIGIDLMDVTPIEGVNFIKGDIFDEQILSHVANLLPSKADLIMSDMAAPSSGDQELDHLRNMNLTEQALTLAQQCLKKGGNFVIKVLPGREEQILLKKLREEFITVKRFKPDASYSDSSEFYLICLGFKR